MVRLRESSLKQNHAPRRLGIAAARQESIIASAGITCMGVWRVNSALPTFSSALAARETSNLTNLTQMDYNLDFVIKKAAGLAPRFNLIPIGKEKTFSGGLRWAGASNDTQTLKITLIPPAERERPVACARELVDGKCPLPVYIVEKPSTTRSSPPAGRAAPPAVRSAPASRVSRADEDRLERGKSRNLLESIDDQLRRQNIGN